MQTAFAFAFTSAANPTLLTAVTVMLASANTKKLMWGYLLGAYLTSLTLGLVIVFALPESGAVETTKHSVSPALDLVLGGLAIVVGLALLTDPGMRRSTWQQKRREKREGKGPPLWKRSLDKGSPRIAFAIGILLSFPGASYLAALGQLHKQNLNPALTATCVIAFCLIQLLLLEIPLLGFLIAPDATVASIARFRAFLSRRGRQAATWGALVIGVLLVIRGLIELLA